MKKIGALLLLFILSGILFFSCNEEENAIPVQGKGTVNIYLTDAPFPIDYVAKTMVTIDRVEIRKQGNDTIDSEFIVLSEETMEVDLLRLNNGVTEMLASVELDAGTYDMIRMRVADSKVILNDETEFDLKVPSGSSSGLKIKIEPAIVLSEGQTTDVLLDFDVSKSFVAKGNWKQGDIKGFNFKPVVRGVLLGIAGRIEGTVVDTSNVALENASVKLWMEGEGMETDSLLTSAFTRTDGSYQIIGIPEGTYALTAELDSFITDTIYDVLVTRGQSTPVDFVLTPELK